MTHEEFLRSAITSRLMQRDAEGLTEAIILAHSNCKDERGLLMYGAHMAAHEAEQIAAMLIAAGIFEPEPR